ncbi:hypothetical protein QUQ76_004891, partial [Escherichia coli]|nr:hypothetical protein [Escherichia coli]
SERNYMTMDQYLNARYRNDFTGREKAEFDRVMQGADIYSGVRSDIRESTQNAVDAYYRYRVDKMCADISKNVLDSLSDKI